MTLRRCGDLLFAGSRDSHRFASWAGAQNNRKSESRQTMEQPWIRSYAVFPRRLSDGAWIWLSAFEWQWRVPNIDAPRAVRRPV
ncbi:MAG TPA: hypothetical protein VIO94_16390, partial [Phenylobacterium sp.]